MCYVTRWYRGEESQEVCYPRIWRQPTDHSSNCYFCMVDPTKRHTGKNAPQIVYPDIPSSIAPLPHCLKLPVPTPPKRDQPSSGDSSKSDREEDIGDLDYVFTDALRREGHTSLTRKTSTSETLVLPSPPASDASRSNKIVLYCIVLYSSIYIAPLSSH